MFQNRSLRSWRDGLEIKRTFRGPKFYSQHPPGSWQTLVLGDLVPSLTSVGTRHTLTSYTHIHAGKYSKIGTWDLGREGGGRISFLAVTVPGSPEAKPKNLVNMACASQHLLSSSGLNAYSILEMVNKNYTHCIKDCIKPQTHTSILHVNYFWS